MPGTNYQDYALAGNNGEEALSPEELEKVLGREITPLPDALKRATIVTLDSICRGLGISLKDFFDWRADLNMILKDDERVTIEGIRSLDTEQQARLQGYLKALLEEKKK